MADQVAVPATPQVADITIPADAPKPDMENISQAMDSVAKQLQAPLPSPYTQGAIPAEPNIKPVREAPNPQQVQPMNNTAMAQKSARTANGIRGILGLVSSTSQKFAQNKQDQLKTKLVDVMQSKQQIENAKKVLAQDPNNQMAKGVLEANSKKLEAILSDPKNEKQLKKALDISYVDPEKNKTPEVKAAVAADKEVKGAGAFSAANPQEAQVAQMAQAPPKFAAPAQANVKSTTGTPEVMQANPRAAAALAKDTPTLETNPQYAVKLQQRETAQKQMMTLAPHLIDAKAKAELAAYNAGNQATRLQYKATADMQLAAYKATAQADRLTSSEKTAAQLKYQEGTNQVRAVMARARAAMGVTNDPRLNAAVKEKIGQAQISTLAGELDKATAARDNLELQYNATTDEGHKQQLQTAIDFTNSSIKQIAALKEQTATSFFPDSVKKQQAATQTNAPQPEQPSALSRFWSYLTGGVEDVPTEGDKSTQGAQSNGQQPAIEPVGNTTDQPSESGKDDGSEDSDQY
jgi:hypothetical protein